MTLEALQSFFWNTIATGAPLEAELIAEVCLPSAMLLPVERMQIYQDMYFARHIDALKANFPSLVAYWPAEVCDDILRTYVVCYPSEHPSIDLMGRCLAEFLASKHETVAAGLALLDFTRSCSFDSPKQQSVTLQAWLEKNASHAMQAVLVCDPSMALLKLDAHVLDVWRCLMHDEPLPVKPYEPLSVCVLVWRKQHEVLHAKLNSVEAEALSAVLNKASLEHVCAIFEEHGSSAEEAWNVITGWFQEGWIVMA